MISARQAQDLIASHAAPLPPETVELRRAIDRVLAVDLPAAQDLPPFASSAMDGYALRAADAKGATARKPVNLKVLGVIGAGSTSRVKVGPGETMRIMAGAPLPEGADAIVNDEFARPINGVVAIVKAPKAGNSVRPRGEDVRKGQPLVARGTLLRPYEVALLAAQGMAAVPVIRRPRVLVFSSGDELAGPGESLGFGRVRDSNGPGVIAALTRWGVDAIDGGIVPDEPGALKAALTRALSGAADVILVSGGSSAGDFDYTRPVFLELGLREVFWKVAIKPGRPLLFATAFDSLLFGLPGSPVSSLLCLEEFVRPALERLQGRQMKFPVYRLRGRAKSEFACEPARQQFLYCRAEPLPSGGYELDIVKPQGASMIGMACQANALALAPAGLAKVRRGDTLAFRWLK